MLRRTLAVLALAVSFTPLIAGRAPAATSANLVTSVSLDAPRPGWATTNPHTVLHSSPLAADLDGDGVAELVVATHDGWLYAFKQAGGTFLAMPGWPVNTGAHLGSSPAVADLDRDGTPEIVIGVGDATDLDAGHQGAGGLAAYEPNGAQRFFYRTAPFPQTGETQVFSTPAVGDVDGDGFPDIAFASYNRFIYVIDRNGHDLPGWPLETVDTTWSSPSLVDLDHDGHLSVALGSDFGWNGAPHFGCVSPPTNGLFFVINWNGQLRPGWPKCMATPLWSSAAVVDLGDGIPTAIIGTNNFLCCNQGGQDNVYALRLTDGSSPPGWPVHLPHGPAEQSFSSPAVGDVDGDGRPEIAIGSSWGQGGTSGSVYLIGSDGRIRWSKDLPFDVLGSPVMADVNGDGHPDVIAGDGDWNVYGWDAAGTQTFFFHTDSFVKNAPVVADFNGDGMNEVVVASGVQNDMPKLWELATSARAGGAANPWPMFRGSAARIGASTPVKVVPPRYNFDENLLLANPGSTPAHATVTLQLPAGAPVVVPFDIAPHARVTFPVDEQVPNSAVSAKVDSDQPISAERTMFFNYQGRWDGGHTTHGAVAPATDWFLAEGYTAPNFDTYVLVQNPNLSAVDVTVTLMKPGGETRDEILHLGPQSRSTLVVKNVPGFDSSEVSFRVHGTGPIVVERSMYFDYDQKTGGHDALGVAQLANQWFLAEGYTANSFDTYVLVANPNDTVAHVTYTFLRPSGPPVQAGRDIAPHSRGTIKVDDVPGLDATDVSTRVDSDQPIAVERAMYFDYYGKTGGHDAEGVTGLGSDWYLAEGSTQPGFDTYVLLANPNASDAAVDIEYSREDGTVSHQALTVPANTRQTVHLNDVVPGAGVATHVHVRNGVGIAVERAMYFTYLGTWNGGTDAQAMPAPSTVWDFAEGYTGQ